MPVAVRYYGLAVWPWVSGGITQCFSVLPSSLVTTVLLLVTPGRLDSSVVIRIVMLQANKVHCSSYYYPLP